jgi:hypothetical protein
MQGIKKLLCEEYQSTNLDALPRVLVFFSWVNKCRMWYPSRDASIVNGIKALDQSNFIRSLSILEEPFMCRIGLHSICFTFTVWINQCGADKVAVWDRVCGCNAEGIFVDCLDWTPDVDELEAAFCQFVCFLWKMMVYTILGRRVGLVDVYSANRAAKRSTAVCLSPRVCTLAADGVVKDKDAVRSSPEAKLDNAVVDRRERTKLTHLSRVARSQHSIQP